MKQLLLLLTLLPSLVSAQTLTWIGTNGAAWNSAASWSKSGTDYGDIPTNSNIVVDFTGGSNTSYRLTAAVTASRENDFAGG